MFRQLGIPGTVFFNPRFVSMAVLVLSVAFLVVACSRSVAVDEGGYMGGGLGDPPAAGTIPVLSKEDLITALTNHIVATRFCANSQDYCTCCVAGGPCSTASSRASGMCAIAPDSNGAGGGSTSPVPLHSR
jgi:hypothetical protein